MKFITLLATGMLTAHSHAALTSGLVAYYNFEESGAAGLANKAGTIGSDYAGPFVDATFVGSSATSGFGGDAAFNSIGATGAGNVSDRSVLKYGNAANFSHTGTDAITTAIGTGVLGQNFTISLWFYAAIDPNQAASQRYFLLEDGTSTSQFDVSYGSQAANANVAALAMWGYVNGETNVAVQDSVTIAPASWQNLVLTYAASGANSTIAVYLNGTDLGSYTSTNAQPSFTELNFGNARDGQSRGWDGMIDDVGIWNRVIDPTEIAALQLGAVPEPSIPLIGSLGFLAFLRRRSR